MYDLLSFFTDSLLDPSIRFSTPMLKKGGFVYDKKFK